jgi:hypothetical protein
MKPRIRESDVMESPPTPLRLSQLSDRTCPNRTPERSTPPSSGECHSDDTFSARLLPEQSAAPAIEGREMSRKSAEDISEKIRQDGVRHLLTGRAAGNPAEYGFGGNAFVRSLIVGAPPVSGRTFVP